MKNDPTNHSAGLLLDEDFVKRVMALRGGQNLDGDFLMDLLQAGLAIMELSAGSHDDRCADPECSGCRLRQGEQPAPARLAEFEAVYAQVRRAVEDCKSGGEADRPLSVMVTPSSLIFMAYLDRLLEADTRGGLRLTTPIIDIDCPREVARAGRYLSCLLVNNLERELARLIEGRHPLLLPPRQVH